MATPQPLPVTRAAIETGGAATPNQHGTGGAGGAEGGRSPAVPSDRGPPVPRGAPAAVPSRLGAPRNGDGDVDLVTPCTSICL